MNWIKNFVRPRFPSVFRDRDDTPDNLWDAQKMRRDDFPSRPAIIAKSLSGL